MLATKEKFTLRCGGFGAVFFTALGLFFLFFFCWALREGPGHNSLTSYILALVMMAAFAAYMLYFLWAQKIEIDGDILRARFIFGSWRPTQWTIRLVDISEVTLGSIGQLKKNRPDLLHEPRLSDMIKKYESVRVKGFSMRGAVQFTPLVVVITKDKTRTQVIITKPFSRSGFRKLFAALKRQGIAVSGDEKL